MATDGVARAVEPARLVRDAGAATDSQGATGAASPPHARVSAPPRSTAHEPRDIASAFSTPNEFVAITSGLRHQDDDHINHGAEARSGRGSLPGIHVGDNSAAGSSITAAGSAAGGITLPGSGMAFMIGSQLRTQVNVAEGLPAARVSPLWKHAMKFVPPMENGKNVICLIVKNGSVCNHLMRHNPKNGTGIMTQHMARNHPVEHANAMRSSVHSSVFKKNQGAALAAAAAPPAASPQRGKEDTTKGNSLLTFFGGRQHHDTEEQPHRKQQPQQQPQQQPPQQHEGEQKASAAVLPTTSSDSKNRPRMRQLAYVKTMVVLGMLPFNFLENAERHWLQDFLRSGRGSSESGASLAAVTIGDALNSDRVEKMVLEMYAATLASFAGGMLEEVRKAPLPILYLNVRLWTSETSGETYIGLRVSYLTSDFRMRSHLLAARPFRPGPPSALYSNSNNSNYKSVGRAVLAWVRQVLGQFHLTDSDVAGAISDATPHIRVGIAAAFPWEWSIPHMLDRVTTEGLGLAPAVSERLEASSGAGVGAGKENGRNIDHILSDSLPCRALLRQVKDTLKLFDRTASGGNSADSRSDCRRSPADQWGFSRLAKMMERFLSRWDAIEIFSRSQTIGDDAAAAAAAATTDFPLAGRKDEIEEIYSIVKAVESTMDCSLPPTGSGSSSSSGGDAVTAPGAMQGLILLLTGALDNTAPLNVLHVQPCRTSASFEPVTPATTPSAAEDMNAPGAHAIATTTTPGSERMGTAGERSDSAQALARAVAGDGGEGGGTEQGQGAGNSRSSGGAALPPPVTGVRKERRAASSLTQLGRATRRAFHDAIAARVVKARYGSGVASHSHRFDMTMALSPNTRSLKYLDVLSVVEVGKTGGFFGPAGAVVARDAVSAKLSRAAAAAISETRVRKGEDCTLKGSANGKASADRSDQGGDDSVDVGSGSEEDGWRRPGKRRKGNPEGHVAAGSEADDAIAAAMVAAGLLDDAEDDDDNEDDDEDSTSVISPLRIAEAAVREWKEAKIPKRFRGYLTAVQCCDFWRTMGSTIAPTLKPVAQAVLGIPVSCQPLLGRDLDMAGSGASAGAVRCDLERLVSAQRQPRQQKNRRCGSLDPSAAAEVLMLLRASFESIPENVPEIDPLKLRESVPERLRNLARRREIAAFDPSREAELEADVLEEFCCIGGDLGQHANGDDELTEDDE